MKHRALWALMATIGLMALSCGEESTGTRVGGAELTETTLDACVIDQGTEPAAEPTGDEFDTLREGTLVVGSDTAFPPFESIEGGKAVGFDIDLITEVAKRIGPLEVDVQTTAFDTIFTSLAAKRFDAVISAVTIKEDRKRTVDFSDPYFKSDLSLSVREADADEIRGVDDLEGKTVGVQGATTGEDCAKNALQAQRKVEEVRAYDAIPDAFTDLSAQRVDAVIIDLPTAQQIVADRRGIEVVQLIRTNEEYGIAVSKENPNLRVAINEALDQIREDGTYDELFMKWFKTEPPA